MVFEVKIRRNIAHDGRLQAIPRTCFPKTVTDVDL